ncbi:MAG TPA: type II toxin-antitoxin system VapC family toxin [Lacipirellula sp.]
MLLTDVNVLIYAAERRSPDHERYKQWLDELINGDEAYGVSDLVLSAFLRIVTNPRIHNQPMELLAAIAFAESIRNQPTCVVIQPGPRHWGLFTDLCRRVSARGNLVPDAYLAALAIESGSEWITTDRDYARFPGLRWRHPLDE